MCISNNDNNTVKFLRRRFQKMVGSGKPLQKRRTMQKYKNANNKMLNVFHSKMGSGSNQ